MLQNPIKINYLKSFIQDCRYYDLEKKEIKTIIEYVNLKNKKILDIGTGIGRLAFPLSKYAKKVIAIDNDRRLINYCKKSRSNKIEFINFGIENFIKKCKDKFDIILIAWPIFNKKTIRSINKIMHKNNQIIFITCDNNSEYEKIPNRIEKSKNFEQDIKNKRELIKFLTKNFHVIKKRKVNVAFSFPNERKALEVLSGSLSLWFNIKINQDNKYKLIKIIKEFRKNKKVIIPEKVFLYLLGRKKK